MRSISTLATLFLGLTLAAAALAKPPPAGSAPKSGVFEFVGFSFEMTDGTVGLRAINEICQDEFGPDTRICERPEFLASPNAEAPSGPAWVGVSNCKTASNLYYGRTEGGLGTTIGNESGKISSPVDAYSCQSDAYVTCCARLQ